MTAVLRTLPREQQIRRITFSVPFHLSISLAELMVAACCVNSQRQARWLISRGFVRYYHCHGDVVTDPRITVIPGESFVIGSKHVIEIYRLSVDVVIEG